jgi:A/G-specific adenine glycosylase
LSKDVPLRDKRLSQARGRTAFRRRLLRWFRTNARDLPWRKSRDPYRVWVSEIMLQQTQVETVKAYFERFVDELPDVHALASAEEERVLQLWEGLGYYRRARQMHRAAQVIVAEHGGEFPRDVTTLRTLPGIGRYTAGAIASIAFDEPAPILEANTIRLFARLLAYRDDLTNAAGQQLLWRFAEEILPAENAGIFNQALMELGSLVCTPKSPACRECPALSLCPTFARNLQSEIPRAKAKTEYTDLHEVAVVIRRREKILVRRCGPGERWAGLWDFPRIALSSPHDVDRSAQVEAKVCALTGVAIELGELLTTIKHGVTRYRITLSCHAAKIVGPKRRVASGEQQRWIDIGELSGLPLSTTGRKLAQVLSTCVAVEQR